MREKRVDRAKIAPIYRECQASRQLTDGEIVGTLNLFLLGGFGIASESGDAIALPAKKARALLAYLALHPGRAVPRDKLAALFWGDRADPQARASLRQTLSSIRKARSASDPWLVLSDTETVTIAPTVVTDVASFESLAADGDPESLARAANLYKGHLLDGFHAETTAFEDWLAVERQRLHDLALQAFETLLQEDMKNGNIDRGISTATKLLTLDPLAETAHRSLMRLYAMRGRHSAALRQYRICKEMLQREFGVPPSPETERLHDELTDRGGQGGEPPAAPAADAPSALPETRGAAAPAGPELRQATVLFADISVFSRLSNELDPEDVHDLLQRFFQTTDRLIGSHGGQVDKHIGDCVMAVFGVPVAHSNDPERAVRTAMAIHEALAAAPDDGTAPVRAHIGIACGQVLIGADGAARTVTGKSVNLAARLTDLAGAGETLLSESVRHAIGERLRGVPTDNATIAGQGEPVTYWRLLGLDGGRRTASGVQYVGREAERRHLQQIMETCLRTRQGHTILLRGDAGIGKTRLIEEFSRTAEENGFECHVGRALDFGIGSTGDPIRALVRSLVGVRSDTDVEARGVAVEEAIAAAMVSSALRASLYELMDLELPMALKLVSSAMNGDARRRGKLEVIAGLIRARTRHRPALIVVEDVHWADPLDLERLAGIAATVCDCPAILVMTTRIQGDPIGAPWRAAAGSGPVTTIDLGPLDEPSAMAMALQYTGVDEAFSWACVTKAEGNPLFLDQLLRHRASSGEGLPGSVHSLFLSRLDRLEPLDRTALQAASVLGKRFSPAALRHLIEQPDYRCDTLVRHALVKPESGNFLFSHALVHQAAYASLLKSRKRALHERAADWYAEKDLILRAEHLDSGGNPEAPNAYLKAAEAQAEIFRYERALHLVERANQLDAERALQHDLAMMQGSLYQRLGASQQSIDAYRRALDHADNGAQASGAWTGIAAGMRLLDAYPEALAALDEAEQSLVGHDEAEMLCKIYFLRGNIHFPLGQIDACMQAHETARGYARQAQSLVCEARALGGLGDAYYQRGLMRAAFRHFDHCMSLCEENGYGQIRMANLPMRGMIQVYLGEPAGAERDCRMALDLAVMTGNHRVEILSRAILGLTMQHRGDWRSALSQSQRSLALARYMKSPRFEAEELLSQAMAIGGLGDRAAALKLLDEAFEVSKRSGLAYTGPWILGAIAYFADDADRRRRALAEGERLLGPDCVSHNFLHFYPFAIDAADRAGDWDEMTRYADALAYYGREEMFRWIDFFARRGRVLADHRRGMRDETRRKTMLTLIGDGTDAGYLDAVRNLERAVAEYG